MYYSKIRILNRYYTAVYMVQVIVHSAIQPKTYKYNWLKSIGHLPVVFLNSCLSYTNFFTMLLHLAFLTVQYYERSIAKGIAFLTWSNTSCITFSFLYDTIDLATYYKWKNYAVHIFAWVKANKYLIKYWNPNAIDPFRTKIAP